MQSFIRSLIDTGFSVTTNKNLPPCMKINKTSNISVFMELLMFSLGRSIPILQTLSDLQTKLKISFLT